MPAPSTSARSQALPSRLRSREGSGAGPSDPCHGGNQHQSSASMSGASQQTSSPSTRSRSSNALPVWFVKHARHMLHEQRAFRVDQLNRLDAASDTTSGAANDEIDAMLREAAQSVLTLIDVALRRIEQGTYGHCKSCGDPMSLGRLTVLPMANWCWLCHRTQEMAGAKPSLGSEHSLGTHRDT